MITQKIHRIHTLPADGFTLLEIVFAVVAIGILASIAIAAINPRKQMASGRNSRREMDILTVAAAIHQYTVDNDGTLPSAIRSLPAGKTCLTVVGADGYFICKTGAAGCSATDLSVLTANSKYLPSLPIDPQTADASVWTGYVAVKDSNSRVIVCAPSAENGAAISVMP